MRLSTLLWFIILPFIVVSFTILIGQAQDSSAPNLDQPYYPPYPSTGPSASPFPTTLPTPKIIPSSPFSIGSETLQEILFQFDIMALAQIILVGLALVWFIAISITIVKKLFDKISKRKNLIT